MSKKINSEILAKVNKGIESVRPYLTADGGDVELTYEEKLVKLGYKPVSKEDNAVPLLYIRSATSLSLAAGIMFFFF